MTTIEELKQIKNDYVKDEAKKIIGSMIRTKSITYEVSTCDHYNWDRKLHENFESIADELRANGFNVTSTVNFGVTDWIITFN